MNILKRPMLYAAIICFISAAISLYTKKFAFVIIVVALLLFAIAIFCRKYKYITVAFLVLLFSISLYNQFKEIDVVNEVNGNNFSGDFIVVSEPELYDDFTKVTLSVNKCEPLSKDAKILVFDTKKTDLRIGDIVVADITLAAIDEYDEYRLSNYSNAIYATANVTKITKTNEHSVFYKTVGSIRKYVKNTVSSFCEGDTQGLMLAVTTGDKTLVSDRFLNNVKTTGISHVIVVSGMHLSIIMSAVFWLLDRLFYNKYIRSILSVAFVIFIFGVCGFTMSITRAGAMFIISGLAPIFDKESDSLNSLLTACLVVLISAPFAVFNISFQLSVLSTLAIIWVVPFYYNLVVEKFKISSQILKAIINISFCSICAVIFTLPITIRTFGFMSIVSVITNLLITYPITIILVLNVISLAIYAIPGVGYISYPIIYISVFIVDIIVWVVNTIAKLPITVAVLPQSAFWWSIGFIMLIVGYMYFYEFRKKRCDLSANRI